MRRKKKKILEKDKIRIIKINKEALWEFIYESVIDNLEEFFDISDCTTVTSHFDINFENGNFICLINNTDDLARTEPAKVLQLPEEIDLESLLNNMEDTTESLYQPDRFKEFTIDEIKALQCKMKRGV
ncbi:MAG: hypothetical protein FWF05_08660 [Oscillospiraceae bacterium]|nr:hypothetical protein [Oscillospiraceae bacterium]